MQRGGKDLPEWETFLQDWIAFPGKQTGIIADRFLNEALNLLNSSGQFLTAISAKKTMKTA